MGRSTHTNRLIRQKTMLFSTSVSARQTLIDYVVDDDDDNDDEDDENNNNDYDDDRASVSSSNKCI